MIIFLLNMYCHKKLISLQKNVIMKLQFRYYSVTTTGGQNEYIVLPHNKWISFAANTIFANKSFSQINPEELNLYLQVETPEIPKHIKSIKEITQKEYQKRQGGYKECIYTYRNEYYTGKLPDDYIMWGIISDNCCSGILTDLIGYIDDLERIYVDNYIFNISGLEMLYNHMTGIDPAAIIESATRLLYGISIS